MNCVLCATLGSTYHIVTIIWSGEWNCVCAILSLVQHIIIVTIIWSREWNCVCVTRAYVLPVAQHIIIVTRPIIWSGEWNCVCVTRCSTFHIVTIEELLPILSNLLLYPFLHLFFATGVSKACYLVVYYFVTELYANCIFLTHHHHLTHVTKLTKISMNYFIQRNKLNSTFSG